MVQYSVAPKLILGFQDSSNAKEARENLNELPVEITAYEEKTLMFPALDFVTETLLMGSEVRKAVPKAILTFFADEPDDYNEGPLSERIEHLAGEGLPVYRFGQDFGYGDSKNLTQTLCELSYVPTTTPRPGRSCLALKISVKGCGATLTLITLTFIKYFPEL